jgi:hypothetical protein
MTKQITGDFSYILSEKIIRQVLGNYLTERGWEIEEIKATNRGIDLDARMHAIRWTIRSNCFQLSREGIIVSFVSAIGEIVQRMNDPNRKYSIVLPDIPPFRRLWERLPVTAKERIRITVLFVHTSGNVTEKHN